MGKGNHGGGRGKKKYNNLSDKEKQIDKVSMIQRLKQHLVLIGKFFPYLWPKGRWDLRIRVIFALICLIVSKILSVTIPFSYKFAIDDLSGKNASKTVQFPWVALLVYGIGKLLSASIGNIKDSLFIGVRQNALKDAGCETFEHLHKVFFIFFLINYNK